MYVFLTFFKYIYKNHIKTDGTYLKPLFNFQKNYKYIM